MLYLDSWILLWMDPKIFGSIYGWIQGLLDPSMDGFIGMLKANLEYSRKPSYVVE